MSIIESLVVGVASSLAASFVFAYLLFSKKPILEFSPEIAEEEDEGGKFYSFKVINKTSRSIVDIRAELCIMSPRGVDGGNVYWTTKIPLIKDHVFEIGPFSEDDDSALYAFRFATEENLREVWQSKADDLRLRVIATDSLTGLSSSTDKVYHSAGTIKQGSHKYGPNLAVAT